MTASGRLRALYSERLYARIFCDGREGKTRASWSIAPDQRLPQVCSVTSNGWHRRRCMSRWAKQPHNPPKNAGPLAGINPGDWRSAALRPAGDLRYVRSPGCSYCTGSAATNDRDASRDWSPGANGRCDRNVCTARVRDRCARGQVRPRAGHHANVDSAPRAVDSLARSALSWRPPYNSHVGATLGATRTNDLPIVRTDVNSGPGNTRGHERV